MISASFLVLPLALLALPLAAQTPFAWKDTGGGQLELRENGRPVLVYNYGPQWRNGAPENQRRCCYIYPLFSPAGVSLLEDFPPNEFHHRGMYWAWEDIETGGRQFDLWKALTVGVRGASAPVVSVSSAQARLTVSNVWEAGGHDIVREQTELTIFPAHDAAREVRVAVALEAIGAPVTLRAALDQKKSFGGLNVHFSTADHFTLRADGQTLAKDEDLNRHEWLEVEGDWAGKRVVTRITPDPQNPGLPYQWTVRTRGFVGASFPGRTESGDAVTLVAGKPVHLAFVIRTADVR